MYIASQEIEHSRFQENENRVVVHIPNIKRSYQGDGKRLEYCSLTSKYPFSGEGEVRVVYHLFTIYGSTVCANGKRKYLMVSSVQVAHLTFIQKPKFTESDEFDVIIIPRWR